jgi:GNAT superfamily N-acetyltransferase
MSEIRIIPLDGSLEREAAQVIARSFRHEAATSYSLDLRDDAAVERLSRMAEAMLAIGRQAGTPILVALGPYGTLGVAVAPSPHGRLPLMRALRIALSRLPHLLGPLRELRYRRLLHAVRALPPRNLPKPHYSLKILAVHPEAQGRGIGRLLLQAVADIVDADERAAGIYLVTFEARTRDYYERSGYRMVGRGTMGPVPAYHMFRDRAAPAGSAR